MAKKQQPQWTRSEQLNEIDAELDAAMERLDGANVRIDELLANINVVAGESAEGMDGDESDPADDD